MEGPRGSAQPLGINRQPPSFVPVGQLVVPAFVREVADHELTYLGDKTAAGHEESSEAWEVPRGSTVGPELAQGRRSLRSTTSS